MNLFGPLRTTFRGFEDRGSCVHDRASKSAGAQSQFAHSPIIHRRPPASGMLAVILAVTVPLRPTRITARRYWLWIRLWSRLAACA